MSVCPHRNAKGSCEAKICKFEVVFLARLDVAMQNSMRVAVQKAGTELMSEFLTYDMIS